MDYSVLLIIVSISAHYFSQPISSLTRASRRCLSPFQKARSQASNCNVRNILHHCLDFSVSFADNDVTDEGAATLAKALRGNATIELVDLGGFDIILNSHSLSHILLSGNQLTEKGRRILEGVVSTCASLKVMRLNDQQGFEVPSTSLMVPARPSSASPAPPPYLPPAKAPVFHH